jgi:hypothetical protein
MARIAPSNSDPGIWKDRNQYTARLYGIPKTTNTVILMRSIKNLNPKTCYIPKCSISGKERNFAIISFQTKEDLHKACLSSAKYLDYTLTWSKSRMHHINIINSKERFYSNKNKYKYKPPADTGELSPSSSSSPPPPPPIRSRKCQKKYKNSFCNEITGPLNENNEEDEDNISSFTYPTPSFKSSPPSDYSCTPESSSQQEKREYKGKGKAKQTYYNEDNKGENNTTEKIIALISQIASRLDHIENNMGMLPNRS